MADKKEYQFKDALSALQDQDKPFPPALLHKFSDLSSEEISDFQKCREKISDERMVNLFSDLNDLGHVDYMLDFSELAKAALKDQNPEVRQYALCMLMESTDPKFADTVIEIAKHDPNISVRSAALDLLGQFVLEIEYDSIPEKHAKRILACLEKFLESENKPLRLKAMEALAFTERIKVEPLIRSALHSGGTEEVASAMRAIRHSLDARWADAILDYLDHPDLEVQVEAIRAAGQIHALKTLGVLYGFIAAFDEQPRDIIEASIEALAEMSGEKISDGSKEVLLALSDALDEDDDFQDLIDESVDNLDLYRNAFSGQSKGNSRFAELMRQAEEENGLTPEEQELTEQMLSRCLEILQDKAQRQAEWGDEDEDEEDERISLLPEELRHLSEKGLDPGQFRIIDDLAEYEQLDDEEE